MPDRSFPRLGLLWPRNSAPSACPRSCFLILSIHEYSVELSQITIAYFRTELRVQFSASYICKLFSQIKLAHLNFFAVDEPRNIYQV